MGIMSTPAVLLQLQSWKFFNTAVPKLLKEYQVPGAAIAVVTTPNQGIQTFTYGYSNLDDDDEKKTTSTSVSPTTPFASGSVAKLFVWTSIMQLWEKGKLKLDDPISKYLDFGFPDRRVIPESDEITIMNLMTHSAGWEDYPKIGSFVRDLEDMPDLGEFLATKIPQQDFVSSKEMAYSNYGSGLAGYIVELISGAQSYGDYVTTNILKPLQMDCTSANLPLSEEFQSTIAKGYKAIVQQEDSNNINDKYEWFGNEYLILYPAGHLEMCAVDAGKFMLAYLQDGSLDFSDGTRILQPSAVELMQNSSLFRNLPYLPGNAYGFWENQRNYQHILNHQGDVGAFAAHLALLPDHGVGYYLTTNGDHGSSVRKDLWDMFIDEYFPSPYDDHPPPVPSPNDEHVDKADDLLDQYVGYYAHNRMSSTSMSKVISLLQTIKVTQKEDNEGNALLAMTGFGLEWTWIPMSGKEEGRFYDQDRRNEEIVFTKDDNGNVDGVYLSEYPFMVFRPVSKIRSPTAQMLLMFIGILLAFSGLIVFPIQMYCCNSKRKMQQEEQQDGDGNKDNNIVDQTHMDQEEGGENQHKDGGEEEEEPSEVDEQQQQQQQQEKEQEMTENEEQITNNERKESTESLLMMMRLRWIGILTSLFLILFGILCSLDMMMGYPQFPPSPTLKTSLVFGYMGTFLLFLFTPLVVLDWYRYNGYCCKSPSRIHMAFFLLGGWILVSIMIYWKMIFARL